MDLSELTTDAIDYIYENMNTDFLNSWERTFFEDTKEAWEKRRYLTDKQKLTLGKIWDKQP